MIIGQNISDKSRTLNRHIILIKVSATIITYCGSGSLSFGALWFGVMLKTSWLVSKNNAVVEVWVLFPIISLFYLSKATDYYLSLKIVKLIYIIYLYRNDNFYIITIQHCLTTSIGLVFKLDRFIYFGR